MKIDRMDKNTKKELREVFRNQKVTMAVVGIFNDQNNKVFIKSTINAEAWTNKTKFTLKMGTFENRELQKEWTAFGENPFRIELLEELPENEELLFDYKKALLKMEDKWATEFLSQNKTLY